MRITRGLALVAGGLAAALAGCGTAGTAGTAAAPAGCPALLSQLEAYGTTLQGEARAYNVLGELASTAAFELDLRQDAAGPQVPQKLWAAETGLAGALQTENQADAKTALLGIKSACGAGPSEGKPGA